MTEWDLFLGCKDGLTYEASQYNLTTKLTEWKKKNYLIITVNIGKKHVTKFNTLCDKNTQ